MLGLVYIFGNAARLLYNLENTSVYPWCLSPHYLYFIKKHCHFFVLSYRIYLKYGSPVKMMESYIAVLTKGICQSEENGSFLSRDFDGRKAYLAGSIKGEKEREGKSWPTTKAPSQGCFQLRFSHRRVHHLLLT